MIMWLVKYCLNIHMHQQKAQIHHNMRVEIDNEAGLDGTTEKMPAILRLTKFAMA